MKLVKIEDGLLEQENFLINSPVFDFINGMYVVENNNFKLHKGTVERAFNYKEFVIEIEKDISLNSTQRIYVANENIKAGIEEVIGEERFPYWKILCSDNYVQTYRSNDKRTWENIGGFNVPGIIRQGFEVAGDEHLTVKSYKVFKRPYLTIQNFNPGTIVKLLKPTGEIIERTFTNEGIAELFIDIEVTGRLQFYEAGDLIGETGFIQFKPGDIFLNTLYDLEVSYKENVLETDKSTHLNSLNESIFIKNLSIDNYSNMILSIEDFNDELVEVSLDNITFSKELTINLNSEEIKEIFIRITKANTNKFNIKEFSLNIR